MFIHHRHAAANTHSPEHITHSVQHILDVLEEREQGFIGNKPEQLEEF